MTERSIQIAGRTVTGEPHIVYTIGVSYPNTYVLGIIVTSVSTRTVVVPLVTADD